MNKKRSFREIIGKYAGNCFWFFIPVMIFNAVFAGYLPDFYLKNIPHGVAFAETVARTFTIALSLLLAVNVKNNAGKTGLILYVAGLIVYFASYLLEIYFSDITLAKNLVMILAPYWTSFIWLSGIGLIGNKLFFKIRYHYMVYIAVSLIFAVLHTYHGYLCYTV